MSFDAQNLTPAASLNRALIVDLPGFALEDRVKQKTGFDLLSQDDLNHDLQQEAASLFFTDKVPKRLSNRFGDYFQDARTHDMALALGQRYGRDLGYLLLMLKRGDPISRTARPDWDDSYWAHWANIQQVWLGGGLMQGPLGQIAAEAAQSVLAKSGQMDYTVSLSPYTTMVSLPLMGAARYAPPEVRRILVVDCGGSWIKSGIAVYEAGELIQIEDEQYEPANCGSGSADPVQVQAFANYLVAVISRARQRTQTFDPLIICTIANYVKDGQVVERGCYGHLRLITDHLQTYLSKRISSNSNQDVVVKLIHDGTAAAAVHAGAVQTVVLTLGTAIGIGFPPAVDKMRAVSSQFMVVHH